MRGRTEATGAALRVVLRESMMPRKKTSRLRKEETKYRLLRLTLIGIIAVAVIFILMTPVGQSALKYIFSNALIVAVIGSIIAGIILLYIEHNYLYQKKELRKSARGKSSSIIESILDFFAPKKRKQPVITKYYSGYNWSTAQRIALQSFKDKLDKYQWVDEEANVTSISTDKERATLNVVITSKIFAKPIPVERYTLVINKLGDILEMQPAPL